MFGGPKTISVDNRKITGGAFSKVLINVNEPFGGVIEYEYKKQVYIKYHAGLSAHWN